LQILALPRVILQIATTIGLRFCAAATAGSRFGMDTPTGRGDAKAINDGSTILVNMAFLLILVCEGDALVQRTCARLRKAGYAGRIRLAIPNSYRYRARQSCLAARLVVRNSIRGGGWWA